MQPTTNLHSTYGLPLCISGITQHLILSKEMADHDRRREAMKKEKKKKKRSQAGREGLHTNQEMGTQRIHERVLQEIRELGEIDTDLATILQDLCHTCSTCAAKAA